MVTFPVWLDLGIIRVHSHLIAELLAFAVGFQLFLWARRRQGDIIPTERRLTVVLGAAIGAALGAKLLVLAEHAHHTLELIQAGDWIGLAAGKTIVGALLGGLIGVELTKRIVGERTATGDHFVLPLIVGITIGRIGCFLAGLDDATYGLGTSLPWGVDFGDAIQRHPTQVYEQVFLLTLGAGIWWWHRAHPDQPNGRRFRQFMVGYLAWRFCVDWIKPRDDAHLGLSAIQLACLLGLLYYAWLARTRSLGPLHAGRVSTSTRAPEVAS